MPPRGTDNLTISAQLKGKLKALKERDPKTQAMTEAAFISYLLQDQLFLLDNVSEHGRFLEYKGMFEREIHIRDNLKQKTYTLHFDDNSKQLRCEDDNYSSNCLHIGFAYAVVEVYNFLIEHGFRPPKKIS